METANAPGWNAAMEMVKALRSAQEPYRHGIEEVLSRSCQALSPLCEPLLVATPLTQMLSGAPEETYSDWLAWSLEQIGNPSGIFAALGIQETQADGCIEAKREYWVPEGHSGHRGRLDVSLFHDGKPLVDVEVKLGSPEMADTAKQDGYARWGAPHRILIAKAPAGERRTFEGEFKLRPWSDLCAGLRKQAQRMISGKREDPTTPYRAALILSFIAAVEENLLKVPGARIRQMRRGPVILSDDDREIHTIRLWLQGEDR